MRVEGGTSGGSIFFRGQQLFQLGIFRSPCGLLRVKGVGQTAPAHIPGKNFLLLRRCLFSGFLQIFQQLDCRDIGLKLDFRTAFAQVVVGDTEILSGAAQVVLVFPVSGFLGCSGIGEGLPLDVYKRQNRVSARITGTITIFNSSFNKNTNALIVMPPPKSTVPVPDSIIPVSVSYTHLDVYKRQPYPL